MYYVVDFDKRTFGPPHQRLDSAVKEFEALPRDGDYHYSIVSFTFLPHGAGTPTYSVICRHYKSPFHDPVSD